MIFEFPWPLSLLPGFLIIWLSFIHASLGCSILYLPWIWSWFWIEAPASELITVHMILTITTNPKWLQCTLDQVIRTFFWNFKKCQAVLYYMLLDLQMFEKVFSSKRVRSISSGNHLFHKAENMGRSCPNQVWAITFDWSALATWNKHFWTAFW